MSTGLLKHVSLVNSEINNNNIFDYCVELCDFCDIGGYNGRDKFAMALTVPPRTGFIRETVVPTENSNSDNTKKHMHKGHFKDPCWL